MSKILPIQSVAGSRIREFGWSRRASAMYSCQQLGSLAAGRQKFTVTSLLCEHPQNAVGAVHLKRTLIVHTDPAGFPSFLTKAAMVCRVSQGPRGRAGRLTSTRPYPWTTYRFISCVMSKVTAAAAPTDSNLVHIHHTTGG